ncbi:hypothetical protein IPM65_00515 [Candidatus Roizmanbacteria bacterium]|nr:MAG: hypothetical protein IPM65_00515 [Candidatus Roizmanbacteria bacterium]
MKNLSKILSKHYPVIIYLFIFTVLFSVKLIQNPFPFFDWDESIYAEVGYEMVHQISPAVPLWQGQYWLDKPPLVPLFYGVVMLITPFLQPEISTRLATLFLSVFALGLLYALYYRVLKETWITTLVVMMTSLTSIFLQRAQVLNVDVFLLIGWLGYVLFYRRFWTSLIFLSFSVYSKSLIGFYPIGIMGLYFFFEAVTGKISWKEFAKELGRMILQAGILLIWHLAMFLRFGPTFLYQHFYESHVKRVTASIESHFGQRTFYIDLLTIEYGKYIFFSALGFIILFYQWIRNQLNDKKVLYSYLFLPWFVFLNLTKTKIFWYGHPYLGQFAFLMVYPITLLKKIKLFYFGIIIILMSLIIQHYFFRTNVLDDFYSSNDPHHELSVYANDYCQDLYVVVEPEGREASKTLEELGLLISTSRWWGNHPSMVYYFDGNIRFVYTLEEFEQEIRTPQKDTCFVLNKNDTEGLDLVGSLDQLQSFDPLLLYLYSY